MHVHTHAHVQTQMHMHIHTCTHAYTHACMHAHILHIDRKKTLKSLSEIFLPLYFEPGIVLKIKAEVIYLQTVYLTFVPPTDGTFLT